MRIVQILESFAWGDAIGNHVQALDNLFARAGLEHAVFANAIDPRLKTRARHVSLYDAKPSDLILYHLSTGSDLNFSVATYPGKLVINYHNITPAHFFEGYNERAAASCASGREGLRYLAKYAQHAIAVSDYNAHELEEARYRCPVDVVPILLDMRHLGSSYPMGNHGRGFVDGLPTRVLFVGRIAPNKRIERVIEDFTYIKRIDPRAKLTLVGNAGGMESYLLKLRKYVRKLRLADVEFQGHVSLDVMVNHFRMADVFLCESAHEGFCVPLVEAMHFGLPIVAQDCSAVGDTLGEGGLLLTRDDPREAARAVDLVLRSTELRERIKVGQRFQLDRFNPDAVGQMYLKILGF